MAKILVFSTGYNELHVSQKNMTKFLEIVEESKTVSMEYDPTVDDYSQRIAVHAKEHRMELMDQPTYANKDDFDHMVEVANQVKADAEARAEESDA